MKFNWAPEPPKPSTSSTRIHQQQIEQPSQSSTAEHLQQSCSYSTANESRETRMARRSDQKLKAMEDEDLNKALRKSMHGIQQQEAHHSGNVRSSDQKNEHGDLCQQTNVKEVENRSGTSSGFVDDEAGHLKFVKGDLIQDRYEIVNMLGDGTFSRVVKVRDLHCPKLTYLAMKIIRNIPKYSKAALEEVEILRKLCAKDLSGRRIVRFIDSFEHQGHVCMLFTKLGLNTFEVLKNNNYRPFDIDDIMSIGYQLIQSVKFLHDSDFVHTDLKPENILFVNGAMKWPRERKGRRGTSGKHILKNASIRLIDFGSTLFLPDGTSHHSIVQTREYRAPEVIMRIDWNKAVDIWSIGCILFELYTGDQLFQVSRHCGEKDKEHLAMIEKKIWRIPYGMARKSRTDYFQAGTLLWRKERPWKKLEEYQRSEQKDHCLFFALLYALLRCDPNDRLTLAEALKHPLFDHIDPTLEAETEAKTQK